MVSNGVIFCAGADAGTSGVPCRQGVLRLIMASAMMLTYIAVHTRSLHGRYAVLFCAGADAGGRLRQELPLGLRQRRVRRVLPKAEGPQQLQARFVRHAPDLPPVREAYPRGDARDGGMYFGCDFPRLVCMYNMYTKKNRSFFVFQVFLALSKLVWFSYVCMDVCVCASGCYVCDRYVTYV